MENMENQEITTTTTEEILQEMEDLQETSQNEIAASIDNLTAKVTDLQGELHFAFLSVFVLVFFIMLGKILKNMIDI